MSEPRGDNPRSRLLVVGAPVAIGAILIAMLVLVVRSSAQPPKISASVEPLSIAQPTSLPARVEPTPTNAAPSAAPVNSAANAPSSSTTNTTLFDTIVALVNDAPITDTVVQEMQAADIAIAQMLRRPTSDTQTALLARVVNGELVWQAAQNAGFVVSATDAATALTQWLNSNQTTQAALDQALHRVGLTSDQFAAYFTRLITIDRFAAQQGRAANLTTAAYVSRLRKASRISLGPAATTLLDSPLATAPSTPVSQEVAVADLPAPTPAPAPLPAKQSSLFDLAAIQGPMSTAAGEAAAAPSAPSEANVRRGVNLGDLAPLFDAPALPGSAQTRISLDALLGKPTVLSFWTTWCPYCQQQTPILVAARQQTPADAVNFVGIDVQEDAAAVAAYVAEAGIDYPIALDSDGAVAAAYAVNGYPTTYFLDANAHIVALHLGALTRPQIDGYLAQLTQGAAQ